MEILTRGNYVNGSKGLFIILILIAFLYAANEEKMVVSKEINSNLTNEIDELKWNMTKQINSNETMKINPIARVNRSDTRSKVICKAKQNSNTSKMLPCLPDLSKFVKHDVTSFAFGKYRQTELENTDQIETRKLLLIRNSVSKQEKEHIFTRTLSDDKNTTSTQEGLLTFISSENMLEFAILLKLFYYLMKCHRNYIKSTDEKKKLNSHNFLFQMRGRIYCSVNVYMYPNSLKQYMNRLGKNGDKNVQCMNNEWARLESFKTFPEICPVSTLKLAKAGFYSTENGQEAVCFSCGLKNDIWTETETVEHVHKRLSPNCKFLNGDTTENISIHGDDKESQGACGGPEDNDRRREKAHKPRKERSGHEMSQISEQNIEHITSPSANSIENSSNEISENERNSESLSSIRGQYFENVPTEEIRHFPGIVNELPKHPEYAIKSERLSSYSNWASTEVVKPEDLSEAGFFFCAIPDLVRCFFCGGGMKNWEYGDSPWIEHARWFPACAYLKQCKGEDFVNLCQISSMNFQTPNNFQVRDLDSEPTITVADQQITDINSIAAKRVLDMGYTQPQVENAIKQTRQRIGPLENLKAQNLLEYLIDNSYKPANVPTSTSTVPPLQNNTSDDTNSNNSSRSSSPAENGRNMSPKEERKILEEENRCLKEQKMCKVCMDKDANIVFLPCGHLVSCVECAHALRKCAVCRAVIQGTVRTYAA